VSIQVSASLRPGEAGLVSDLQRSAVAGQIFGGKYLGLPLDCVIFSLEVLLPYSVAFLFHFAPEKPLPEVVKVPE
jgi:hypothetical protein